MTRRLRGHVLTPAGFVRGELLHAGGRIAEVTGSRAAEAQVLADPTLPIIVPGFIDTHVHGGGGSDVMDAGAAIENVTRVHALHGTTALLATTMTAPLAEVQAALRALAPHIAQRRSGAASVLGVHLEGPYISPERLGAQPAFARAPAVQEILALHALAPIRVLTLAPEWEGALAMIPALVEAGIRVQIGHTAATYEQAKAALDAGASGFTHLFNAMSPLHQRAPGAVGAALAHAGHAELIPDLQHVHPGAIRAALRAIPGLFCVTDATAATAMPDGAYRLGRQTVHKCLGGVRLADGTLAGSTLTMIQALRNLLGLGLNFQQASAMLSARPAHFLGLSDRGELTPGAWADAVVLDTATLALREVWIQGEAIDGVGGDSG
jgi:N-acetylglucosamine-6-phosphate deacetylase